MNAERASDALVAVKAFGEIPGADTSDTATLIGDLLANLMHLCDAEGVEFDQLLARARRHHDAEMGE